MPFAIMQVAAFFDIDGTILTCNSARLFAQHMWSLGLARRSDLLLVAYYLIRYRLGLLEVDDVTHRALEPVRGRPESWLRSLCEPWYDEVVRGYVHPRMRELVEDHRARGHVLVLLSSSTCYLGDPLGDDLGIEHRLVNRLEVDEAGVFTGGLVSPICYRHGKVTHARRFAEEHGIDLEQSYFYTDSITDLPVLEIVGEQRIVSPDPRLRREARRRGWPVLDLVAVPGAPPGPGGAEAA